MFYSNWYWHGFFYIHFVLCSNYDSNQQYQIIFFRSHAMIESTLIEKTSNFSQNDVLCPKISFLPYPQKKSSIHYLTGFCHVSFVVALHSQWIIYQCEWLIFTVFSPCSITHYFFLSWTISYVNRTFFELNFLSHLL
jgi:hypothetical protein